MMKKAIFTILIFLFGSLIRSDTSVGEKKYIVFSLKALTKNFDIIKKVIIDIKNITILLFVFVLIIQTFD